MGLEGLGGPFDSEARDVWQIVGGTHVAAPDVEASVADLMQPDSCFINLSGLRVHYKICTPPGWGRFRGPLGCTAVVLVHGFGAGAFAFRHVAQQLANDTGCAVVSFDRPGFGLTSRPRPPESSRRVACTATPSCCAWPPRLYGDATGALGPLPRPQLLAVQSDDARTAGLGPRALPGLRQMHVGGARGRGAHCPHGRLLRHHGPAQPAGDSASLHGPRATDGNGATGDTSAGVPIPCAAHVSSPPQVLVSLPPPRQCVCEISEWFLLLSVPAARGVDLGQSAGARRDAPQVPPPPHEALVPGSGKGIRPAASAGGRPPAPSRRRPERPAPRKPVVAERLARHPLPPGVTRASRLAPRPRVPCSRRRGAAAQRSDAGRRPRSFRVARPRSRGWCTPRC